MIKNIQFRFTPFNVTFLNGEVLHTDSESEIDLLPWCSLPDILFEGVERRFIGLSFPVDIDGERAAQEFVNSQKSELLRWLLPQQAELLPRYAGFGNNGRLEMMWAREKGKGLRCEFASLFNGAWRLPGLSNEAARIPVGYILMDLQHLLVEHDLKLP